MARLRDLDEIVAGGLSEADANLLVMRLTEDLQDAREVLQAAWTMGATVVRNVARGRRVCRICGCWELEACDGGCSWVEVDLCSSCARPPAPRAGVRLVLEPTDQVVLLQVAGDQVICRVWQGESNVGARVAALIPRVAVHKDEPAAAHAAFERALLEVAPAGREAIEAFPLKVVL
jgi:hypothetical protein